MFSGKDLRVMQITKMLEDPYMFTYIERYFDDCIRGEEAKINKILDRLVKSDIERDSLNLHLMRKKIYQEIKWGLRESLIEYMRLDDSDFTESGGAEYQKVNGD